MGLWREVRDLTAADEGQAGGGSHEPAEELTAKQISIKQRNNISNALHKLTKQIRQDLRGHGNHTPPNYEPRSKAYKQTCLTNKLTNTTII